MKAKSMPGPRLPSGFSTAGELPKRREREAESDVFGGGVAFGKAEAGEVGS